MHKTFFLVFLLVTLILIPTRESYADQARLNPMIHQSGTKLVDGNGKAVDLKGVNLEGWIQWEGLFFGASMLTSGSNVKERLAKLVGPEREELFERAIYNNFITERDISKIAELGFNCVRLPVTASALEGPQKQFVWELIDHALDWCDKYGVY